MLLTRTSALPKPLPGQENPAPVVTLDNRRGVLFSPSSAGNRRPGGAHLRPNALYYRPADPPSSSKSATRYVHTRRVDGMDSRSSTL